MAKFAATSGSFSDDIRIAASLARKAGFAGLVVPSRTPTADLTELGETGSREYRHVMATVNQNLVAIDSSLGKDGFAPRADIDRALDRLGKVVKAAADLGRAMVCLDLGPLPPVPVAEKPVSRVTPEQAGLIIIPEPAPAASAPTVLKSEQRDTAFEASLKHALRELGQIADRLGTMVAMRSSLASFASLEGAISAAGCPWFGIDLDTAHLLADDWAPDEVFSRLGAMIRHVRARDAAKGAGGRVSPCAVGAGSVNWPELFSNFDATAYKGFLTIDTVDLPNRSAAAELGLVALHRLT